MTDLKGTLNSILPLNRKERFYTGTVFPMIVCSNNFKNIDRFFELIPNFPRNIKVNPSPDEDNNVIFFTEYSLAESLVKKEMIAKYDMEIKSKDTPDVVIMITKPEKYLIVCEAKMYSSATLADVDKQMKNQKWVIDAIKKAAGIKESNIFHLAILPQELVKVKVTSEETNIIFWEEILEAYKDILSEDYFYSILQIAIEDYGKLKSQTGSEGLSYGKNADTKLSGLQIIELDEEGEEFFVGRNGGIHGDKLRNDILSGGWKKFEYEINLTASFKPNRNWFTSKEFVNRLKLYYVIDEKKTEKEDEQKTNQKALDIITDEWHFSHLGRDYFLDIAATLGLGRSFDAAIEKLYIGKSGVPYREKKNGRNVNPNWSAILENGREFRYGNASGFMLEPGLWKRGNCNVFYWEEIKEYFQNQVKVR